MTEAPRTIRTATYLLWLAVVLELTLAFLDFETSKYEEGGRIVVLAISLAFTAVAAVSTHFFSLGRNWARVALLVLFVLGASPQAGFEVHRKFLSALEPWESDDRDTPSDTPLRNVLRRVALSRRFHAGDVAQFTATLDDMHHGTGMPRPI